MAEMKYLELEIRNNILKWYMEAKLKNDCKSS